MGRLLLMDSRYCILIPHFNHATGIAEVLQQCATHELPILVVDDGSDPESCEEVERLVAETTAAQLLVSACNEGKGGAVVRGIAWAQELGFTHVVQIDADGQHCADDIPILLAESRRYPQNIVSGLPVFGPDIPKSRLHGRRFAYLWTCIETLSTDIRDAMCGFRVYPVRQFILVCDSARIPRRMEFDVEFLVRAYWLGIGIRFVPTVVTYPSDGVSHFRLFRDNVRIILMHTRLCFGALARLPQLLRRALVRSVPVGKTSAKSGHG
jgi:glycosyltransferase involved in cell wall biosynthesis